MILQTAFLQFRAIPRSIACPLRRDSSIVVSWISKRYSSGTQTALGTAKPLSTPKNAPLRLKPASPPPTRADERFRKFNFQLSQSSGPVDIFKAPSHRSYMFGAYSTALFCYLYGGYNFYATSVDPIVKVAKWQEYTFAGVCVLMAAMGTVFLRRGANLIASITATRSQGQTQLLIKVRRMVPFRKQREIIATPDQISFSRQLVVPQAHMTEEGRVAAQKQWESHRAISKVSFFKAPLKKTSLALWRLFMSSRRLFTQEHFAYVKVAGHNTEFRMDTMGEVSPELLLLEKGARHGVLS
ncbi:hypothetical protein PRK78_005469 [Emydomyces testavorans]|uniref:Uncharacterized protein n=1 Tax=Emydomyces testavorans TaxID=2070801 RepID=A0AAF0DJU2_9EURO|nr:hypothetical protein PRK78_005469 [Emydomyces testavorans]